MQEKYEDVESQLRSKDLKNAELLEIIASFKESAGGSPSFMQSYQYSAIDSVSPRQFMDFSPMNDLCNEIARELQLQSAKDILPRVIHLKEYYSISKEYRKLYKKLAESMIKTIGRENVTSLPSCAGLWKWVNSELETVNLLMNTAKARNLPDLLEKLKAR